MKFKITSLDRSAKEIVKQVIQSDQSQLLIPPRFKDLELNIPSLKKTDKQIGLFSSGTTGTPKCVWNSFERLKQNALFTADAFSVKPAHKLLILAAPWHVAGLSWAIMAEKLECDYEFITTKKGDDKLWLKAVKETKLAYLLTVPAVLKALYQEDWYVPNIVFGGYSIDPKDVDLLAPHCETMIQGYGQTEAGGLIAAHKLRSSEAMEKLRHLCCGEPIEGVQLNCKGTADNPDHIFIQSETAFTPDEYDSGDLGFMDKEGKVYILGRADDIHRSK